MDPIKVDFSGKGKPKEVVIPPEKKVLKIIICILSTIVGGCITYYFMLPAINFKEIEFYYFIAILIAIAVTITSIAICIGVIFLLVLTTSGILI